MTLTVTDLTASYGPRSVLRDVAFDLGDGEMLAVLGPSGCGKTTLLRSIAGLHSIDRGVVELDGRVLESRAGTTGGTHVPTELRGIGLMPQEGGLFPHLDVFRNIEFGLRGKVSRSAFRGRAARRRRVEEMAELVGLPDALRTRPGDLSGGQQQRIALARALAPNPALVLMDEPFAALDAGLRTSVRSDVRELLRISGTASILVTHDQVEALGTADRVAVLLDGRCAQIGTPRQVYLTPSERAVAQFVGDGVFLDVTAGGLGYADTVFGRLTIPKTAARGSHVLVRPEQFRILPEIDGDFTVLATTFAGAETSTTVRHEGSGRTVTVSARGGADHVVGRRVCVVVDGQVAVVPTPRRDTSVDDPDRSVTSAGFVPSAR